LNLLYLSVHSIAEYEELKLFSELGITCISQGTYNDPSKLGADAARPKLDLPYFPDLNPLAKLEWVTRVDPIPEPLVDWADVILSHGFEGWFPVNWERIRRKHVVFRCNGQSVPHTESVLGRFRPQGLKVVRYSPLERFIPGYCGEDALIRFYKDESEYKDWNGAKGEVVTVAQSIRQREAACKFSVFDAATQGFPRTVYGTGNEDLGGLWGGRLGYEQIKAVYRDNRAYLYTGTAPAQYTMNFMEAWMTGIPVVAAGGQLMGYNIETPYLIEHGVDGYVCSSVSGMRECVGRLLSSPDKAAEIGKAGRESAIRYFSYPKAREQWRRFFDSL
jgi:hypothetical protein